MNREYDLLNILVLWFSNATITSEVFSLWFNPSGGKRYIQNVHAFVCISDGFDFQVNCHDTSYLWNAQ